MQLFHYYIKYYHQELKKNYYFSSVYLFINTLISRNSLLSFYFNYLYQLIFDLKSNLFYFQK